MQEVPEVSREDVLRVVRWDHPVAEHDAVLAVLDEYGGRPCHRERDRVHLAVLKLAGEAVRRTPARTDTPARLDGTWRRSRAEEIPLARRWDSE